ncbi:MAG: hypothetical protein ABGX16_19105 [Pirellulales bacterium]
MINSPLFLLVFLWLTSALHAAEKTDVPSGYEQAPVAVGKVKKEKVQDKGAEDGFTLEAGVDAVQALGMWLVEEKKVDPQVLAFERQYLPKFQKLLKAERYRVYLECDLSPEQKQLLALESERFLKDVVRAYCIAENNRRHQGQQQKVSLDPNQMLRDHLACWVREHLGQDEYELYFEANRLSRQRRQRVTVLNLVVNFDNLLMLTSEQRGRLAKSLNANWQEEWGQRLPMFIHGPQFLPEIPGRVVLSVLNKKQEAVWLGMKKNKQQVHLGPIILSQTFGCVDDEEVVNGQ